jgi:tRNA dimethylallyltransferase
MIHNSQRVFFLMGPTASGKTALAVKLAERFPVEIISVDSAQVYRQMNIGTAKPETELLSRVPHHLLDVIDPSESYSAAHFAASAKALIEDCFSRQVIPLLAGGTMLYFKALQSGLSDLPNADPQLRRVLQQRLMDEGLGCLHAELSRIDPQSAARIHANDQQRTLRALEVYALTGKPLSAIQGTAIPLAYPVVKCILSPPREVLHQRIAARFQQMIQEGLIDEVKKLRARGDLSLDHPSMRCVGYRQVWQYLDGDLDYEAMLERGVIATRQLAKRQLTWLRREHDAHWCEEEDAVDYLSNQLSSISPSSA